MGKRLRRAFLDDLDDLPRFWVIAVILAVLALTCFAAIVLSIRTGTRYHDERACASYARQNPDRVVEFRDLTFFEWDCYVQTPEGWVPRESVLKVEVSP